VNLDPKYWLLSTRYEFIKKNPGFVWEKVWIRVGSSGPGCGSRTPDPVKRYGTDPNGSKSGFATLKGAQQAADALVTYFWLPIKKKNN
jgi:hypothetical protein